MKQSHQYDPAEALKHLRKSDPDLGKLMRKIGPFGLEMRSCESPFQGLAESIVYQQLHGKAAATILGRLKALYPKSKLKPELLLDTPLEDLRGAGLSGSKAAAMYDLAQKTLDGLVPTFKELNKLDDEAIIKQLIQVRGIGRWTVEMLLIFRMGRPDLLPVDDFAIRKGFSLWFRQGKEVTTQEVAAHGERWAPFRSVASWYLWRASELG
jgi:3-methyladenine DNA glycosylase/8-oxoguanine DNA glycosylase